MRLQLPKFLKSKTDPRVLVIRKHLKSRLGIPIRQDDLYVMAMRHKSAARNLYQSAETSNERLEFLGDAVLDTVVADHLFIKYPEAEEGALTKMKSRLVSRKNLNSMAQKMGLSEIVETDLQASHARSSIGGNALEALFGAMYIDLGYVKTRKLMLQILKLYVDLDAIEDEESDFKSRLYEEAHKIKGSLTFNTTCTGEKDGAKQFRSSAILNNERIGEGSGTSKKKAEQHAARMALRKLNVS